MSLRLHFALALSLTALGLAPGVAHVLELPVKLAYPPDLYTTVTSTLYAWFGIVGGAVQVAAAISVVALAVRTRGQPVARMLAAAAGALVASLLLWGLVVAPVNAAWAEVLGSPAAIDAYLRLRPRWEYGHVAAVIAWATGWIGLVAAVVREIALDGR
ncbi:MAG: hypothetical protein AB7I32_11920 [Gammaproteobacteria bacterium]